MRRPPSSFSAEVLRIDCEQIADRIAVEIRRIVIKKFRKKGVAVGISGGVDSSVVAALCTRALSEDRVLGLLMPDGESATREVSTRLGRLLAESLGIPTELEDITPILEGAGCYRRRDEALRKAIPDYGPGWKSKLVLPSVIDSDQYRIYSVVAVSPSRRSCPRSPEARFIPRSRCGDELQAANQKDDGILPCGSPQLRGCRYTQSARIRSRRRVRFFVKGGDGLADIKPIAHLVQVTG